MIWLIAANTNSCRIFLYDKKSKKLTLIKELNHAESKLKGTDLTSDGPGHYQTSNSARGAYSPREEAQENEIKFFSRQIAKELDVGRKSNSFDKLILAVPPHMNGLIQQHMDSHLKDCITNNIKKDFTHLKEKDILESLIANSL